MISVPYAAYLSEAIYDPVAPSVFAQIIQVSGVVCGYKQIDETNTFTFRGSTSVEDWLRDFDAIPYDEPVLGRIHAGFWRGMEKMFAQLRPLLTGPISIQGHSLGAAHAPLLAALCAEEKIPVEQLVLLAPPRPGYQQLRDLVQAHIGIKRAFVNGLDPVPALPPATMAEPWRQTVDMILLHEDPEGVEAILPVHYHAVGLYRRGIERMYPS